MNDKSPTNSKSLDTAGLLHLMVVYIVWSSTYLAIRYAVREGAGFPPFTLGMLRAAVASVLLLLWVLLSKGRVLPRREELPMLIGSGLLLWLGGNGLVTFAEQRADSGLAALLIAATPIWVALIEAVLDRKLPSLQLSLALLTGFAGIAVVSAPELRSGIQADTLSILALIGAEIAWSFGSIWQARRPGELSTRASAGYQMLFGALGFGLVMLLLGEPRPTPSSEALWAYVYLVFFGSVLAFTSYVTALKKLPTRIVMTYAFVNPVLAVALGWFFLQEEISAWTVGGSLLVLVGVAGVFRERQPGGSH